MERADSLAARDRETLVHPFTNLAEHAEAGPAGDRAWRGRLRPRRGRAGAISRAWRACGAPRSASARRAWCRPPRSSWRACRPITCSAASPTPPAIELAERLLALAPVPMARALFVNSGSEANDTALKLVRYYHQRERQAREAQDHRARARLPRRDPRSGQRHRASPRPSGLRPAAPGLPARRLPALLPLRPARREPRSSSPRGSPTASSG